MNSLERNHYISVTKLLDYRTNLSLTNGNICANHLTTWLQLHELCSYCILYRFLQQKSYLRLCCPEQQSWQLRRLNCHQLKGKIIAYYLS